MVESNVFNITFFFGKTAKVKINLLNKIPIIKNMLWKITLGMMAERNGRSLIPPMWEFGAWNQLGDEVKGTSIVDRAKYFT